VFKILKVLTAALAVSAGLALAGIQPVQAAPAAPAAQITLSPATGSAGSAVTVNGTGFKASASGTVVAGSATFAFRTATTGAFSTPITIPAAATGKLTVTAKTSSVQASSVFTVTPAASALPPVSTARLRFGVATANGPLAGAELDEVALLAGESPSSVLFYKDFLQAPPISEMNAARARGAVPLVTWEPWAWGGGLDQPAYSLDRIAAGDFDARIIEWGQSLAAWGYPVQLRFAHEMNGDWYPWAEGVNGNGAGDVDYRFCTLERLGQAPAVDQVHTLGAADAHHFVPALSGDGDDVAADCTGSPCNGNPHGRNPKRYDARRAAKADLKAAAEASLLLMRQSASFWRWNQTKPITSGWAAR
jgi:hypothetical protein